MRHRTPIRIHTSGIACQFHLRRRRNRPRFRIGRIHALRAFELISGHIIATSASGLNGAQDYVLELPVDTNHGIAPGWYSAGDPQ